MKEKMKACLVEQFYNEAHNWILSIQIAIIWEVLNLTLLYELICCLNSVVAHLALSKKSKFLYSFEIMEHEKMVFQ